MLLKIRPEGFLNPPNIDAILSVAVAHTTLSLEFISEQLRRQLHKKYVCVDVASQT